MKTNISIPILVSDIHNKFERLMESIEANPKGEKKVFLTIKEGVIDFEYFIKNNSK